MKLMIPVIVLSCIILAIARFTLAQERQSGGFIDYFIEQVKFPNYEETIKSFGHFITLYEAGATKIIDEVPENTRLDIWLKSNGQEDLPPRVVIFARNKKSGKQTHIWMSQNWEEKDEATLIELAEQALAKTHELLMGFKPE